MNIMIIFRTANVWIFYDRKKLFGFFLKKSAFFLAKSKNACIFVVL